MPAATATVAATPTGPMCRILRRMLNGTLTHNLVGGRTVATLDGREVNTQTVAQLVGRRLIEARDNDDTHTTYTLTADGRRWAKEGSR